MTDLLEWDTNGHCRQLSVRTVAAELRRPNSINIVFDSDMM